MYMYMYMHMVIVYTLCMLICANVYSQPGGMEVAEAMLPDKVYQLHGDGLAMAIGVHVDSRPSDRGGDLYKAWLLQQKACSKQIYHPLLF